MFSNGGLAALHTAAVKLPRELPTLAPDISAVRDSIARIDSTLEAHMAALASYNGIMGVYSKSSKKQYPRTWVEDKSRTADVSAVGMRSVTEGGCSMGLSHSPHPTPNYHIPQHTPVINGIDPSPASSSCDLHQASCSPSSPPDWQLSIPKSQVPRPLSFDVVEHGLPAYLARDLTVTSPADFRASAPAAVAVSASSSVSTAPPVAVLGVRSSTEPQHKVCSLLEPEQARPLLSYSDQLHALAAAAAHTASSASAASSLPGSSSSQAGKSSLTTAIDDYLVKQSQKGALRFFSKTSSGGGVGVMVHGQKHSNGLSFMADDGSNAFLVSRAAVNALGIHWEERGLNLLTSNGNSSVVGITEPLQLHYGTPENGLYTQHCFLIVDGLDALFDILVGNQDFQDHGGVLKAGTGMYELHPQGKPPIYLQTVMIQS
jgi:hypothetical protein